MYWMEGWAGLVAEILSEASPGRRVHPALGYRRISVGEVGSANDYLLDLFQMSAEPPV